MTNLRNINFDDRLGNYMDILDILTFLQTAKLKYNK